MAIDPTFNKNFQFLRLNTVLSVLNGLLDIIIPLLICNILYESSKVRLTCNTEGDVRFRRADQDDESSEEESAGEPDLELEEWLNDEKARKDSFERKIDAKTARASLQMRDAEWIVAGQITQQFLSEMEAHYKDDDIAVAQDENCTDYESAPDLHYLGAVNYESY